MQQPLSLSCYCSSMLYSSLDANSGNDNDPPADANSYRPFKMVDSVVTSNIQKELDLIEGLSEERGLDCRLTVCLIDVASSAHCFSRGFDKSTMLYEAPIFSRTGLIILG